MEFRNRLTTHEIIKYQLHSRPEIEWWWVTVDENDLKHNIHIYINSPDQNGNPRGWQKISPKTCLGTFAKIILDLNFNYNDSELQKHLIQIKEISENLDVQKLLEENKPWQYIGHTTNGPFMIWDGVHRQNALFIYYFLNEHKDEFKPVKHAVCGISTIVEGDFGRIPNYFCDLV